MSPITTIFSAITEAKDCNLVRSLVPGHGCGASVVMLSARSGDLDDKRKSPRYLVLLSVRYDSVSRVFGASDNGIGLVAALRS